jgi:hypothetical protein
MRYAFGYVGVLDNYGDLAEQEEGGCGYEIGGVVRGM